MKKFLFFLIILTFSASFYSQVNPTRNPKNKVRWKLATYRGLILGKSTYKDVKMRFGKPRWEGGNEENTFERDSEFEILLQYSYQGVGKESVEVVVGEQSRVVKAISYLPYPELSRQEAVSKFGSDYFEISAGESMCINENSLRGKSKKQLNYPRMLVYPEKGMYVSIGDDNKVMDVGYLYKCQ